MEKPVPDSYTEFAAAARRVVELHAPLIKLTMERRRSLGEEEADRNSAPNPAIKAK